MHAYKIATRIAEDGEIRLSELPVLGEPLPPVTRRLLGVARGVSEEDYGRYLEEKYRFDLPARA